MPKALFYYINTKEINVLLLEIRLKSGIIFIILIRRSTITIVEEIIKCVEV